MNEVTKFNFESNEVRTVLIDNEAWFVGKDVAEALGYSKARNAISKHVDNDDKKGAPIQGPLGGKQQMTVINESGVFALIFGSELDSATRFKKWVTSEVLPSIRKTGSYSVTQLTENEIVGKALQIEHNRAERLQSELAIAQPKAELNDVFIATGGAIGVREAAKEMNVKQNEFIDNLLNNKYIYRSSGHRGRLQPYKKYVPKLFVLKSGSVNGVEFTPQVLITPYGRQFFYKKFYAPDQIEML